MGFPKNFTKCFGQNYRMFSLNYIISPISSEYLTDQPRMGLITLIPKKNKDMLYLKNWRPLTMLNTGYKILAKVMADRLHHVLLDIISEEQNGFKKGS